MGTQTRSMKLNILPRPHSAGQHDMIVMPGSFAAFCGRRYGKTLAGVERILYFAIAEPGMYWWVGLSWRSASMKRAWRLLKHFSRQIWQQTGLPYDRMIREQDKEIILPNGSIIWLRTAENPESIAGEGIKGAVGDEFTLWPESVWTEYLEATLLDFDGWVAFFGVPKGNNWASVVWHNAARRKGWKQYHFSSYDNPFMKASSINEIKDNTPQRIFEQEYLAEILDDGGSVFRNVRNCIGPLYGPQAEHRRLVFGVDWGRSEDFTVIAVMDQDTHECIHLERFNQIGWTLQRGRIEAMYQRFRPRIIVAEQNSIGGPNIEALQALGLPVREFTTTASTKGPLIDSLALAFERSQIAIPDDPVLIGELQAYTMERLSSGRFKYNAPSGMHDDTVIALALAWHGANVPTNLISFV